MTTTNIILLLALLVAAALYVYIFVGAKRLHARREDRVREQKAAAQRAASTQTPLAGLSEAPDTIVVARTTTVAAATVASEPAAAQAPLSPFLAAPDGPADDLTQIKGIGPKLSALLAELGVFHFRQIADWTPEQMASVDARLGNFQGRPERDQWQAQARLLASGDRKAYERAHGKLAGAPPAGNAP